MKRRNWEKNEGITRVKKKGQEEDAETKIRKGGGERNERKPGEGKKSRRVHERKAEMREQEKKNREGVGR